MPQQDEQTKTQHSSTNRLHIKRKERTAAQQSVIGLYRRSAQYVKVVADIENMHWWNCIWRHKRRKCHKLAHQQNEADHKNNSRDDGNKKLFKIITDDFTRVFEAELLSEKVCKTLTAAP